MTSGEARTGNFWTGDYLPLPHTGTLHIPPMRGWNDRASPVRVLETHKIPPIYPTPETPPHPHPGLLQLQRQP